MMFNIAVSSSVSDTIRNTAQALCSEAGIKDGSGNGVSFIGSPWNESLLGRRGVSATGNIRQIAALLWEWSQKPEGDELTRLRESHTELKQWQKAWIENGEAMEMAGFYRFGMGIADVVKKAKMEPFFIKYWECGFAGPSSFCQRQRDAVNPTFFGLGKPSRLHYSSHPFFAFHVELLSACSAEPLTLQTLPTACFSQFSSLMRSLAQGFGALGKKRCVDICFYVGDALRCCDSLHVPPRSHLWATRQSVFQTAKDFYEAKVPLCFDVIDMSNLGDHIGAVPLLICASPLLDRDTTIGRGQVLSSMIIMDLMKGKAGDRLEILSDALLHLPLYLLPYLFRVSLDDNRVSETQWKKKSGHAMGSLREAIVTRGENDGECCAHFDRQGHWTTTPRSISTEVGAVVAGRVGVMICFRGVADCFDNVKLSQSPEMQKELGNVRRECLRAFQRLPLGPSTWVRLLDALDNGGVVGLKDELHLIASQKIFEADNSLTFGGAQWMSELMGELRVGEFNGFGEVVAPLPPSFFELRNKDEKANIRKLHFVVRGCQGSVSSPVALGESNFAIVVDGDKFIARVPLIFLSLNGAPQWGMSFFTYSIFVHRFGITDLEGSASFPLDRTSFLVTSLPEKPLFSALTTTTTTATTDLPHFSHCNVTSIEWKKQHTHYHVSLSDSGKQFLGTNQIKVVSGNQQQGTSVVGIDVVGKGSLCLLRIPLPVALASVKVKLSRKGGWIEVSIPPAHYTPLTDVQSAVELYPRILLTDQQGPSPSLSPFWMKQMPKPGALMNVWLSAMMDPWEREEKKKGNSPFPVVQFKDSLFLIFGTLWEDSLRAKGCAPMYQLALNKGGTADVRVILFVDPVLNFDTNTSFALRALVCVLEVTNVQHVVPDVARPPYNVRKIQVPKGELEFWTSSYLPLCFGLAGRYPSSRTPSSWLKHKTGFMRTNTLNSYFQPALLVPLFAGGGALMNRNQKEDPFNCVQNLEMADPRTLMNALMAEMQSGGGNFEELARQLSSSGGGNFEELARQLSSSSSSSFSSSPSSSSPSSSPSPSSSSSPSSCSVCHKKGSARCSGCGLAWYCGREHQRQHWPLHKKECKKSKK